MMILAELRLLLPVVVAVVMPILWSASCNKILPPVAAVDDIDRLPLHPDLRREMVMNVTVNVTITTTETTNMTNSAISITTGTIVARIGNKMNDTAPSVSTVASSPSTNTTNHTVVTLPPPPIASPIDQILSSFRNSNSSSNMNSTATPTSPPPFPSVSLLVLPSEAPVPPPTLTYASYSPNYGTSPVVPAASIEEIKPFTTLTCNANLSKAPCLSWTSVYGTSTTYTTLVTIPCGTCILMDFDNRTNGSSSLLELLGGIDIHGKLVFPDAGYSSNHTLSISTTMMIVQGELSMSSITKPINGRPHIHITMIGHDVNQTFTPIDNNARACAIGTNSTVTASCKVGKKSIVVAGGKVNLRGIPTNTKAWTRLFDAVGPSYNYPDTIYLEDTNIKGKWTVGAEIVITPHTRNPYAAQVRTIVAVSTAPVSGYSAYKLNATILRPTTIIESPDMAVEVALLSRNIVFEGGSDTITYHGGHLMIFHTPIIAQVIEGIEIKNFGQQGLLGRYPIHFHFSDDVPGSIVSKNTIRQSNQRCVVVHGTNKLRIEENVAYDTKGHCYMTEDGIETGNEFIHNLGVQTSVPERLIPESTILNNGFETDQIPATFWISNPDNIYIGNVAAGSHDSGFWFEPKLRGVRQSLYAGYDPRFVPMKVFKNNVVHSCMGTSGAIRTYRPGYTPSTVVTLDGIKVYRNLLAGIEIHRCQNIRIANSFFADNTVSIDIDRTVGVEVINTTIIGESDSYRNLFGREQNIYNMCDRTGKRVGIELHTWSVETNWTAAKISNVTLLGFNRTSACSITSSIAFDTNTLKQGLFEFYSSFQGMRVQDGPSSIDFCIVNTDQHTMVYTIDLDGSLKPIPTIKTIGVSTLLGSDDGRLFEFVDLSKCTLVEIGCYSYCSDTCFRSMRFDLNIPDPEEYSLKVCLKNDHTKCTMFDGGRRGDAYGYSITAHLPVGNEYDATFVSTNGSQASPPYQQRAEKFFCPVDSSYDVTIVDDGNFIRATPIVTSFFQPFFDFMVPMLQLFQLHNIL